MYTGISFLVFITLTTCEIMRNYDLHDFSANFCTVIKGRVQEGKLWSKQDIEYRECLVACINHLRCKSVNYNRDNKHCELLDRKINGSVTSTQKGWASVGINVDKEKECGEEDKKKQRKKENKANKESKEQVEETKTETTWYLGMNLNPDDDHIMDYTTGWDDGENIGTERTAFTEDYLSQNVWEMPVDSIAIVRHQNTVIDAVKVWKFKEGDRSMLARFKAMIPGREIVTEGGPIQDFKIDGIKNIDDDPIFSVSGDIAMNWWYGDNGVRIALDGGHLSEEAVNDDNTHGLGSHLAVDGKNGVDKHEQYKIEISNIQDCPFFNCDSKQLKVQGKSHGGASQLESVPVYGNYAIYVSPNATMFPKDKNLTLLIKKLS